ncbi:transposase, partial [Roseibium litorale]
YGQERWKVLALFTPAAKELAHLTALAARRQELISMKVAETNRLKAPGPQALKNTCKALLRTIKAQLELLDQQVEDLIETCQSLKRRVAVSRSLPGVGPRTAIGLAASMPELGTLRRRQAAALAGTAPHPRDSGTLRGYRKMRGGRPQVRTILFMAALAASRANGPLKAFYQRLIQNGKKPIVAISALMRKIIVILNARIREDIAKQS